MNKRTSAAMIAVGFGAAVAIPAVAFGNARNNSGSQHSFQTAETPYVARLLGSNESPQGDPDAVGAASITFGVIDPNVANGAEVCWDLTYTGLTGTPILAHIHTGAAGVNGAIIIPFSNFGATSASGCTQTAPAVVQQIIDAPSNFYVDVHTSDFVGGAIRGQLSRGAPPAGEAHLLPVPLRAYDSRDNSGPKIAAFETRTISLVNGKDGQGTSLLAVPPGATGAIVTLTVTETAGQGGFLKLYSAALTDPPATSAINWAGVDQNLAVTTEVAVDSAGQVKVQGGANDTHFVIDVIGFVF